MEWETCMWSFLYGALRLLCWRKSMLDDELDGFATLVVSSLFQSKNVCGACVSST